MPDKAKSNWQRRLLTAQRVVIKLGTSIVTETEGKVSARRVEPLALSIARLKNAGRQVVLVSSGAVGLGAGRLGLAPARLHDLALRQACAAVGQGLLMSAYEQLFSKFGVKIAQVLLTEDDFVDRQRYTNLRRTMDKLLKLEVLPIINENDTVSTVELEYAAAGSGRSIFSDNDRLAALVMSKLEADALILLTDVAGLLRKTSSGSPDIHTPDEENEVIPLVEEITEELRSLASGPSVIGRGGMLSKIEAAEIAMAAGGVAVIASGKEPDALDRIFAGDTVGTAFVSETRMGGKRRWIAYAAEVRGRVMVNAGAREAITRGKASLLLSGLVRIEKSFDRLQVVSIVDCEGREFARGIANCGSENAERLIAGKDPAGNQDPTKAQVLVTRDNIVLLEKK